MNNAGNKKFVKDCEIIGMSTIQTKNGNSTFLPAQTELGFEIERVYFLHHLSAGSVRGDHAHKRLKQVIVPVFGSFSLKVNDGISEKIFQLGSNREGLYIPEGIWRTLYDFSGDAMCLVFASDPYKEEDYIRDFDSYLRFRAIKIIPFDKGFIDLSRKWLMNPEIKRLAFTKDFTGEEQKEFFVHLPYREDYKVWGLSYRNQKIGILALKEIGGGEAVGITLIGEMKYWNLGFGGYMLDFLKETAQAMGLSCLYLKVLPENIRAIKCFEKNGFKLVEENTLKIYRYLLK